MSPDTAVNRLLQFTLKSTHATESFAQLRPESFGASLMTPFTPATLGQIENQQAKKADRKQHCHRQQQQLAAEGCQAH